MRNAVHFPFRIYNPMASKFSIFVCDSKIVTAVAFFVRNRNWGLSTHEGWFLHPPAVFPFHSPYLYYYSLNLYYYCCCFHINIVLILYYIILYLLFFVDICLNCEFV